MNYVQSNKLWKIIMRENNYRKLSRREKEINQMVHEQQLWKRELKRNTEIAEQKITNVLEYCETVLMMPTTAVAKVNAHLRSGLVTPEDFSPNQHTRIPFALR